MVVFGVYYYFHAILLIVRALIRHLHVAYLKVSMLCICKIDLASNLFGAIV